jgi:hypothetical protein
MPILANCNIIWTRGSVSKIRSNWDSNYCKKLDAKSSLILLIRLTESSKEITKSQIT